MFQAAVESFDWPHIFEKVWRTSVDQPGWYALPLDAGVNSRRLRELMLEAVQEFSRHAVRQGGMPFAIERFGRFDQQVTSKFHRDGAPNSSLLILGYEPTTVPSRLFVADVTKAAPEAGLELNEFLTRVSPMTKAGEVALLSDIEEVQVPRNVHTLVFINNSQHSFAAANTKPLGLFHRAEILAPDPTATRVINSVGATPEDEIGTRRKSETDMRWFAEREDLD